MRILSHLEWQLKNHYCSKRRYYVDLFANTAETVVFFSTLYELTFQRIEFVSETQLP